MPARPSNFIILAAGLGTRLWPYTATRPKCLVEINNRPLIDYQLEIVRSQLQANITIVGGYCADQLLNRGDQLIINDNFETTNMVESLFCAADPLLQGAVVAYGDIVYSKSILASLLKSRSDISVVVDKNWLEYWQDRMPNVLDDAETLSLGSEGQIVNIGDAASSIKDIEGQFIGLFKVSAAGAAQLIAVLEEIKTIGGYRNRAPDRLFVTDLLQAAIDMGYAVQAVVTDGCWIEIDSVEDLRSPTTRTRLADINNELANFKDSSVFD